MSIYIKFDETTIFHGFTITYKLNEHMSKTLLLAEAYRRLEMCFESLNFEYLRSHMKNENLFIRESIDNLKDGDELFISSMKDK